MKYCEKCRALAPGEACTLCGGALRKVEDGDICLLTTKDSIWAGALCAVLTNNGIECTTEPATQAELAQNPMLSFDSLKVFVPYKSYTAARESLVQLFGQK